MPVIRISKTAVDAAPVPERADAYYWDATLRGFGLRVTPRGVRSYVIQYRMKGRPARRLTLGVHGAPWTPDAARKRAEKLLIAVKSGVDPAEEQKRRAHDARTLGFGDYLDRFRDECLKEEWPDSWQEADRSLRLHVLPAWKAKALPEIDFADVRAVIDPLRPQRALARKVWAVLSRLFSWAVEREDISAALNPMAGRKPPPKPGDRKRVLSPDEIVAAWKASYSLNPPFGAFVRLLFATLQRRTEVAGVPWRELDQARALWTIDAKRAKNDTDHLAPLNALAMRELDALGWKRRGLALSTTGTTPISGFSRMKTQLDRYMLPILQDMADKRAEALGEDPHEVELERWTLHDIRRTGTTAMQSLGVAVEVTEACINHKSGSVSGIAKVYNLWKYEPEKRRAFDLWGAHLERLISGADASSVVALAERRA